METRKSAMGVVGKTDPFQQEALAEVEADLAAVWSTRPLERYWRDLRTSGSHICGMADVIYGAWANDKFATAINTLVMH